MISARSCGIILKEVTEMEKLKLVFMGTPVFACGILQRLVDDGYKVVGVVSQPDKKVGRKQQLTETPVKALALQLGIPVFQPVRIKEDFSMLKEIQPDLIVTCAYGQIVPQELLDLPRLGCINVHASLLPKLRGGAPIHKAIVFGETKTGVSIMRMVKKMDAGAVCLKKEVVIDDSDTMGTLHDKLMQVGAEAISEALPMIIDGSAQFEEQDDTLATFAWNVSKEEEWIDFNREVHEVYNHIRGLIPAPISHALLDGKKVKFHQVSMRICDPQAEAGTIVGFGEQGMEVAAVGGVICVQGLQVEGKSKTTARDFQNGAGRNCVGMRFAY